MLDGAAKRRGEPETSAEALSTKSSAATSFAPETANALLETAVENGDHATSVPFVFFQSRLDESHCAEPPLHVRRSGVGHVEMMPFRNNS